MSTGATGAHWLARQTRRPPGIHAMMSLFHAPARQAFIADLASSLGRVRGGASQKKVAAADVVY